MNLGKLKLTEWKKSYSGWIIFNDDPSNYIGLIALYHNRIDHRLVEGLDFLLHKNAIFNPDEKIIWNVMFYDELSELSEVYNELYFTELRNEEEIKTQVDNFLLRINKLLIFS